MTDLSSNLKGNGMMDLRLPENVHRETENDHMGLELRRTGQKPWQLEGAVPGVWESALQRVATEKILWQANHGGETMAEKRRPGCCAC